MAKRFESKTSPGRITSCIYGLTGSRKSTLAGHLPGTGKLVLLAYDQNAPGLDSIALAERSRFEVYLPDGNATVDDQGNLQTNWEHEANRLFQTDWSSVHPDADAVIVDAASTLCYKLLYETAKEHPVEPGKKQMTTGETYTIGKPKPTDKEMKITNPQLADYGLAQQQVRQMIEWLLVRNPTLDIHCLFHEGLCPADPKEGLGLVFGPEISGSKGPRLIPQLFNTVLWVEVERKDSKNLGKTLVHLRDRDAHVSHVKVGLDRASEVPEFVHLGPDPGEIKAFWTRLKTLKTGEVR